MEVSFIIKRNPRKKKALNQLIAEIQKSSSFFSANIIYSNYAGHANKLAEKEVRSGIQVIIAVGGDGTLNEVLNGILNLPYEGTTLGYFPMGTANDFAKTAGLVQNPKQLINSLINFSTRKINVGKIKCEKTEASSHRYFINIADTGLGGYVAKKLTSDKKRLGAKFTYLKHTILGLLFYKKETTRITMDKEVYQGPLMSLVVCNGRVFGNGLVVSPNAELDSGFLEITLFGKVTLWDYIKNLKNLKSGCKLDHKNIFYYRAQSIRVQTNGPIASEVDGEFAGEGDSTFSMSPFSIKLLNIDE